MKKFILGLLMVTTFLSLTACRNTVHGAGKDLENAGENIQHNT